MSRLINTNMVDCNLRSGLLATILINSPLMMKILAELLQGIRHGDLAKAWAVVSVIQFQ